MGRSRFRRASASDTIDGSEIYGNTIYLTKPATGTPAAIFIKQATNDVHARNNIFYVTGGLPTVVVKLAGSGLLFQGNDYWTGSDSAINVNDQGTIYNTLAGWQSGEGQEMLGGQPVGNAVDPQLQNPGGGPTLASADLLTTVSQYHISLTSPLMTAGVNLLEQGVNPGATDYYDQPLVYSNPLPGKSGFIVGVEEIQLSELGDANGDGTVDDSDYQLIDNGFANKLTGWQNGDFNGDGKIDGSDYSLIDYGANLHRASNAAMTASLAAASKTEVAGTSFTAASWSDTKVSATGMAWIDQLEMDEFRRMGTAASRFKQKYYE